MNTNFIVLGTPRSGSTWFIETIGKQNDILIGGDKHTNFEAFNAINALEMSNLLNNHVFDNQTIFDYYLKLKLQQNKVYLGFKSFPTWHWDLRKLINDNNLNIILLLRKSFFKTVGSLAIAYRENNFLLPSIEHKKLDFTNDTLFSRHFYLLINSVANSIYMAENWFTNSSIVIDKIYYEDIIKQNNYVNKNINNYFQREIIFSTDQVDRPWQDYFLEPEKVKNFVQHLWKKAPHHYGALPDYVQEEVLG